MTPAGWAVLIEGVAILTLLAVLVSFERSNRYEREARARAHDQALQMMADRVQAPERLPARDVPGFEIPDRAPDEWARVGQVEIDPDYGLTVDE